MHMNKLNEAKFLLQSVRFSCGNGCVDESYAKSYERASEILAEFESHKETEDLPEKRADFGWRRNHCEPQQCYGNIPKVPFSQPRRGDHRKDRSKENAHCRKLSFGSNDQSFVNYCSQSEGDWRKNPSSIKPLEANDSSKVECDLPSDAQHEENLNRLLQAVRGKSWADMVEEDELEFGCWKNDENVDSNINHETPKSHDLAEKLELIDFGSGYLTQPEKTARRSLCFDHNGPILSNDHFSSELLSQDGDLSEGLSLSSNRRRRLKVFQDITSAHGAA